MPADARRTAICTVPTYVGARKLRGRSSWHAADVLTARQVSVKHSCHLEGGVRLQPGYRGSGCVLIAVKICKAEDILVMTSQDSNVIVP